MQRLLFVTQSTLYFFHVIQSIKQILKSGFHWASGVCSNSGNVEPRNFKMISLTKVSYLCSWLFRGSLLPKLCLLSWLAGLGILGERLVYIIPHSTLWKIRGEACRNPWVCGLSLGKCFSQELLERQEIQRPDTCGLNPSPIALQLCESSPPSTILCSCWKTKFLQPSVTFQPPVTQAGMS